jgi:hypothetical protein
MKPVSVEGVERQEPIDDIVARRALMGFGTAQPIPHTRAVTPPFIPIRRVMPRERACEKLGFSLGRSALLLPLGGRRLGAGPDRLHG